MTVLLFSGAVMVTTGGVRRLYCTRTSSFAVPSGLEASTRMVLLPSTSVAVADISREAGEKLKSVKRLPLMMRLMVLRSLTLSMVARTCTLFWLATDWLAGLLMRTRGGRGSSTGPSDRRILTAA